MKYINLLFLFVILSSCSDEGLDNALDKLNLDPMKEFIPFDELNDNNSIIFKDFDGNEKKLIIFRTSQIDTLEVDGFQYERERFSVKLSELFSFNYAINLSISRFYVDPMTVQGSLECQLFHGNGGAIPFIRIDENGDSASLPRDDIEFWGTTFNDVISNASISGQQDGFSKIYYNYEIGVVAFRDASNKLWVFDRFIFM